MRLCKIFEKVLAALLATLLFWAPLVPRIARAQDFSPGQFMAERSQADKARGVEKARQLLGQKENARAEGSASGHSPDAEQISEVIKAGREKPGGDVLQGQGSSNPEPKAVPAGSAEPSTEAEQGLPTGAAKSSVTSEQLVLPKGEGSIQGMGESFSPDLSSGTGTFSIPIEVVGGRAGVQPSLTLSYSTSAGDGIAGIGWALGIPFISRQTDKGLPHYVDRAAWHGQEDTFMFNGGQELVPVSSSVATSVDSGPVPAELAGWQQYRAKVEGAFQRFFRSPDSSRWVVQSKDGNSFRSGSMPCQRGRQLRERSSGRS
ncbi:MAG: SpvB/TcaC N-terminal domain-containing protein [Myxococcales bacterium]